MTAPEVHAIRAAVAQTWPPAERYGTRIATGRGLGAGGRVSSSGAVRDDDWTDQDIAEAEAQHAAWDQPALFRVFDTDTRLAAALGARGYQPENPTLILAASVHDLILQPVPPMTAFDLWPPLAIQRAIWSQGGIGTARQDVMDRAPHPKTALLGRTADRAAAAAFVACCGNIAVLHALEVSPEHRRSGMGSDMVRKAAHWAVREGAEQIALAVTSSNTAARGLYAAMGFFEVAKYRYFQRPAS